MVGDLVEIVFEDERWRDAGLEALAERAARATLTHLGMMADGYGIGVLACDDARISVLNADFRGKPAPTNVLSWPAEERATPGRHPDLPAADGSGMPVELGDIAISLETCEREAGAAEKPFADHVTHLLVHGVLHLLGYDHVDDRDATIMEAVEVEVLGKTGIANPYEI
jgi:probable rRNA maturation factor